MLVYVNDFNLTLVIIGCIIWMVLNFLAIYALLTVYEEKSNNKPISYIPWYKRIFRKIKNFFKKLLTKRK